MKKLKIPKATYKAPKKSKRISVKAKAPKQRGATKPPKVRKMLSKKELSAIPAIPDQSMGGPGMDMGADNRIPADLDGAIPQF